MMQILRTIKQCRTLQLYCSSYIYSFLLSVVFLSTSTEKHLLLQSNTSVSLSVHIFFKSIFLHPSFFLLQYALISFQAFCLLVVFSFNFLFLYSEYSYFIPFLGFYYSEFPNPSFCGFVLCPFRQTGITFPRMPLHQLHESFCSRIGRCSEAGTLSLILGRLVQDTSCTEQEKGPNNPVSPLRDV